MSLLAEHDALLLDLDGVVYTGPAAIAGVPEALDAVHASGVPVRYITNNASRPPSVVADHLRSLGIAATDEEVVTSSQAAARMLADRHAPGAPVLVVGGRGLLEAVSRAGLTPVRDLDASPVALVQGFDPSVGWEDLASAAQAIHAGVPWLATNTDLTIPTERGTMPGNGSLVAAVTNATGVQPEVAGKPEPGIFHAATAAAGSTHALMVGDRLDTDILGGNRAGVDTLLVLSGVHGIRDAALAPADTRPTYLGLSVASVLEEVPPLTDAVDGEWAVSGDARARVADGRLTYEGRGLGAATAVVAAVWSALDAGGNVEETDLPTIQDLL